MANKTKKKAKKIQEKEEEDIYKRRPWIAYKTGIIVIAICSIALAVLTAVQTIPALGIVEGTLWGLLYGGIIWAVFALFLLYNKLMKRLLG